MRALRLGAAIAAIGMGVCAGAALADEPPSYPRPYTPVYTPLAEPTLTYDWTGIYFGGQVGAVHTQSEWTYDGTLDSLQHEHTGFTGGAHVGLQKQWSWLVFGAEVSYLWMDQPESTGSALFPAVTLSSNVRNMMLVTGKFGWAWENILASFKGGWATADVDFRTTVTGAGTLLTSSSGRENGWTAGASIEYAVWDHVILGIVYDYVQFNSTRTQISTAIGPIIPTHADAGVDIQSVTARLSFKFGGSRSEPIAVK
jgi:outer membrane immunogenic protein